MQDNIKLSELIEEIQGTIEDRFEGNLYWVSAQIMNVKKYASNRRCYLTLEEKQDGIKIAEVKAVFWNNCYHHIENFEKHTKQVFKDGLEIICLVRIRFHMVYGLSLDVQEIDLAHTLGTLELERQQTLERLLKENPETIQLFDGVYRTLNNRLPLPLVIERVALITAPNSDGQRDFQQEISKNRHGYTFIVKEFLTTIQGDNAHHLILEQLNLVRQEQFDAVAIVRGGGSQHDFKAFEDYELAKCIANFPIPIFTGIGHDRNTSIADLMAREQKTPTKVAATFVEHNFEFENKLMELKTNFFELVLAQLEDAKDELSNAKRIIRLASPQAILNRGFAIIMKDNEIVTDPDRIGEGAELQTLLRNETIYSTVTKKTKDEKRTDL